MVKNIAVFGATGHQGGSVVRTLMKNANYHVKAVTRNPDSEKAQQLAKLTNVSVHKADLNDSFSLDEVLQDCYGVFFVTNTLFSEQNTEIKQGINLVESAITNKVAHVIYSGLENVQSEIGKSCLHFDSKAIVEDYGLRQNEIIFTSIRLSQYYQTFVKDLKNRKTYQNEYIIAVPTKDKPIYCIDVNETGSYVEYLLDNSNEYKSKIVSLAGDQITVDQVVETLNIQLEPNKFINGKINLDTYLSFGFPGVKDLATMYEYYQSGKMVRDINFTKQINKNAATFNEWIQNNKQDILAEYFN